MVFLISLLLVAQGPVKTSKPRWDSPDILIEDSLGGYVNFAADYNYTTGDIYVACTPDSGTYFGPDYWGLLLFRSSDHGLYWDLLYSEDYEAEYNFGKEIDLVVTRNDTAYILLSWHNKSGGDEMGVAKAYDGGSGIWQLQWITPGLTATEIHSPKLVKDDFDDFYLYMAYLNVTSEADTFRVFRSTDRGYNWDILMGGFTAGDWQDQDIAVADSSLYHISTFQYFNSQTLQFSYWRDRGNPATVAVQNLLSVNTNFHGQLQYPRIGATTTLPDTTQLVYVFYSQEDSITGNHDLLYLNSETGGIDWDTIPDTLADESYSPVICDLRGFQAAPNQYMNVTYCFTYSTPSFENFWCWASESNPTNWQELASVGTGPNRSIPELIYSPGSPGTGSAVFYNDSLGNIWLDAPWFSGLTEDNAKGKYKIESQIVLPGSIVEVSSTGATVYDITGREIIKLNTDTWDLKDGEGKEVKGGIYFIVDKETGNRIKLSIIK